MGGGGDGGGSSCNCKLFLLTPKPLSSSFKHKTNNVVDIGKILSLSTFNFYLNKSGVVVKGFTKSLVLGKILSSILSNHP